MANAFDSYLRGKQSAMAEGRNMLAMEQAVQNMQYTQQKRQREQQLQGILAGAYQQPTAAIPAQAEVPQLDAAPAMGPLQPSEAPLPDYPSQDSSPAVAAQPATAGGLSMRNALNAMYQGGFGKEALEVKKQFWNIKRGQKVINIAGVPHAFVPGSGFQALGTREAELGFIGDRKSAEIEGKGLGDAKVLLADMKANLPRLQNVVTDLRKLGKTATYTKAGLAKDYMMRQSGFEVGEGAVARARYISTIDNVILPLLKQTFGAAFTEKEGETLKATMGNPDASPREREAALDAFIEEKVEQINSLQRRVAPQQAAQPQTPKAPQGEIKTIGGKTYIKMNGKWYQQ